MLILRSYKVNMFIVSRIRIRYFSTVPVFDQQYLLSHLNKENNMEIRSKLKDKYLPYFIFNENFGKLIYQCNSVFQFGNRVDFYCFFRYLAGMTGAVEHSKNRLPKFDKNNINRTVVSASPIDDYQIKIDHMDIDLINSTKLSELSFFASKFYPKYYPLKFTRITIKNLESVIECLYDNFNGMDIEYIVKNCEHNISAFSKVLNDAVQIPNTPNGYTSLRGYVQTYEDSIDYLKNVIKFGHSLVPQDFKLYLINEHIKYLKSEHFRSLFNGNLPTYFFYYDLQFFKTPLGSPLFNKFRGRKDMVMELLYFFPYKEDFMDFINCIKQYSDILYLDISDLIRSPVPIFPILFDFKDSTEYNMYLSIMKKYLNPFITALENLLPQLPSIEDINN